MVTTLCYFFIVMELEPRGVERDACMQVTLMWTVMMIQWVITCRFLVSG